MNGVWTSLVAVFATLAGSALTFVFQRHSARQAEEFARARQVWQEKLAAYSAYAATLTTFRRTQNDRWFHERADPDSPEFRTARAESYRSRAEATAALCRLRLICDDDEISRRAQEALDLTADIHEARDEPDRAGKGDRARLALEEFLSGASAQVR